MSWLGRLAPPLAWTSWALVIGAGALLVAVGTAGVEGDLFHYQDAAVGLAYPYLGGVVLRRSPRHPVGWILVAAGLSGALGVFAEEYVTLGEVVADGGLPLLEPIAWLGSWTWAFFFSLLPLLLLLFPDGALPGPRWRPVLAGTLVPSVLIPALLAVHNWGAPPGLLAGQVEPRFEGAMAWLFTTASMLLVGALVAAVVALGLRWRRSRGVARQQIKAFFVSATAGVGCLVLSQLESPAQEPLGVLAFLLFPAGMVAAISRYHLYDLDRVVSRTVAYAAVTSILAITYLTLVFGLNSVLPGEGQAAVAASTLAVAALFDPLRRRVQSSVDRRFNRARFDAARTVESFSRRLRLTARVGDLRQELLDVAAHTLQPASVSLWLRP